jgi:hypothetical protein
MIGLFFRSRTDAFLQTSHRRPRPEKETAGLVGPEGILTLLRTVVADGPGIS